MTVDGLMSVPAPALLVAQALDRHPDFRVLRRMRTMDRPGHAGWRSAVCTGVAIDVETTGRDPDRHSIIELGMQAFGVDQDGRIVETGEPRGWFECPGEPISAEITGITGIRDEDVKGRAIPDGEAVGTILGCDFVVAHNAAFDRPFLERRLPEIAGCAWACSLADVDWGGLGFEARKLKHLAMEMGWFYEPHRATVDVTALLHILDHRPSAGPSVATLMLERARRDTYLLEATDAPFGKKDILRERGWRWDRSRRVWSIEVDHADLEATEEWATLEIYGALRCPERTRRDWRTRYSG
ncbi:3'-5' exonuclease [Sphingomonas sp. BK580]|uniref:3'-5' exonuclease n=1 Tax=Sphingomonas sp. BK580 TaxID=2586972 RepID=UPI00160F4171|nr:3'-5' exonuclease [Sphingomonas sp. BK580]MBB3693558.1 DNA polymerase-3 subunit epsilon [Sphingomonas sp. BK580]